MQTQITEGEKIDAIKAHLKKHKGKYLLGAAVGATAVGVPEIIGKNLQNDAESNLSVGSEQFGNPSPESVKNFVYDWSSGDNLRPSSVLKNLYSKPEDRMLKAAERVITPHVIAHSGSFE